MQAQGLNLRNLTFLVASQNAFYSQIVLRILHSFGAGVAVEARDAASALQILYNNKIDALICDYALPPKGGIDFVRSIRADPHNPRRSIPILVMAGDPKMSIINEARNAGANMVVGKPISPAVLFDRLVWIAHRARKFYESDDYFGPDRRVRFEGFPGGKRRRKDDPAAAAVDDRAAAEAEKATA